MSVGSISGSAFNPQEMASKMAAAIMKEADKDGSGTLSKTELTAFKDSKGGQGPNVDDVFSTYSRSGTGELTQSELQGSIEAEGAKMQAMGGGPGGPPPGGATQTTGASSGVASTSTSGASSSTKMSTDARDKNQDGTVTEAEILAYSLTHPDRKKLDAETESGRRSLDISG